MPMLYPIYENGATFNYKGRKFVTVGIDAIKAEIECQTVPADEKFYWFKVTDEGTKVSLIYPQFK